LLSDSLARGLARDDFYHVDHRVLRKFKRFQSLDPNLVFPGSPVAQAFLIWGQTPRSALDAMMKAIGFDALPDNYMQMPGITVFSSE
jgi:hypothetical protein